MEAFKSRVLLERADRTTIIWLLPVFLLLNTALKSNDQINTEGGATFEAPEPFSIDGFWTIIGSGEFWGSMGLSFMIVIPVVVIAISLASLADMPWPSINSGSYWIFDFCRWKLCAVSGVDTAGHAHFTGYCPPVPVIDFTWLYDGTAAIVGAGLADYLASLFGAFG